MSNNDYNDNGNMSKSFKALLGSCEKLTTFPFNHSYDILGAKMLWKPKEARILKNFKLQNEECHH
jgi:hypothetical protein